MRRLCILLLLLCLLPSCESVPKNLIEITPDLVITDSREQTLSFSVYPNSASSVELLPAKSDAGNYETYMQNDDKGEKTRHISGDWFHIVSLNSTAIEVNIKENTSEALRRLTFKCERQAGEAEVVIIQQGKEYEN